MDIRGRNLVDFISDYFSVDPMFNVVAQCVVGHYLLYPVCESCVVTPMFKELNTS